jgi:hypothetical protein
MELFSIQDFNPRLVNKYHNNWVAHKVATANFTFWIVKSILLHLDLILVKIYELYQAIPCNYKHWHCIFLLSRRKTISEINIWNWFLLTDRRSFYFKNLFDRTHSTHYNFWYRSERNKFSIIPVSIFKSLRTSMHCNSCRSDKSLFI